MSTINSDTASFPVQPDGIDTSRHFWDAFDHSETEISARWLVRFAQAHGRGWEPFTAEQIEQFYQEESGGKLRNFSFNRLIEPGWSYGRPGERELKGGGWIVKNGDLLYFTPDFVLRCAR